ncbi:GntR family transcriptional regulator [Microbaculum sp. FT89]|uniref:GntR family transcriptional regulator n=1 Tax=Microbaculum sp. FT89 TaxID=3447298 RepID=UPI003F53A961
MSPQTTSPDRKSGVRKLAPLHAKTLVDQVVDAIVEATATGVFLPGDRVVEAEVARSLNVSRVPVREALRILESQGIVVNERYRGMRLMDVSVDRLEKILKVRTALETLAVQEVLEAKQTDPGILAPLEEIVDKLHEAVRKGDSYGVASLDTEFHRTLCRLSGNDVLLRMWEPLSRQLTIIFGLSTLQKDLDVIAREHDELLAGLQAGDNEQVVELVRVHILDYSRALDYEGLVTAHRSERKKSRSDDAPPTRG